MISKVELINDGLSRKVFYDYKAMGLSGLYQSILVASEVCEYNA